ncbi:MAG: Hpt domain-containing protein [Pseudomonadota bacterium]|jgi:HPt (histidine-containing phosphotransfer) domain-containing protein|nr:Hpt domain-containing protein [Pseudomonadota bacterium]MEC8794909.1 Hpt domain-containing protein [Pseudomonadota bacterium]
MIDWDRVRELRAEVGEDAFDEVVELFLDEVDQSVESLTPECDVPATLHFIKGSAANLGFNEFCAACAEAEQTPADQVDLAAIRATYHDSRTVFLSGLNNLQAAA